MSRIRRDARVAFHAAVPDPRSAIGVACRAAQHETPEHVTLHVLKIRLHVPFVTDLAAEDRSSRLL